MRARLQRWGNSLAIRIPKAFAADLGIEQNSTVELSLEDGSLVLRPADRVVYRLDDLLENVTRENLHDEQDYGPPVGGETW
jgi:antitoxin MazE